MKSRIIALFMLVLVMTSGSSVLADNFDIHTVSISVQAINEIAISGDVSITINAASAGITAGDSSFSITNTSSTMDVTSNELGKKITAILSGEYTGITLEAELTIGGVAQGAQTLNGTTAVDLAAFDQLAEAGIPIAYTASCDYTRSPVDELNTVTFTLIDDV